MALNNVPGVVKCAKTETILITACLTGGGNGVTCTVTEPFNLGSAIASVARADEGDYTVVFTHKFPQLLSAHITVVSATSDRRVFFTAIDVAAGTAAFTAETAGVPDDLATTEKVYLTLVVRNSGQH